MKEKITEPIKIETIAHYHDLIGIKEPEHPQISYVSNKKYIGQYKLPKYHVINFFQITLFYDGGNGGRLPYRFSIFAPGQLVHTIEMNYFAHIDVILIDPEIMNYPKLAKLTTKYSYLYYLAKETAQLADKWSVQTSRKLFDDLYFAICSVADYDEFGVYKIRDSLEDDKNNDLSVYFVDSIKKLFLAGGQIYKQHFKIIKPLTEGLVSRIVNVIDSYYKRKMQRSHGQITWEFIAAKLDYSPHYLNDILCFTEGVYVQDIINSKLIEMSAQLLSTTPLSFTQVGEKLGFKDQSLFINIFSDEVKKYHRQKTWVNKP